MLCVCEKNGTGGGIKQRSSPSHDAPFPSVNFYHKMICMSSLRISELEAETLQLQDVDNQKMGLTSNPSSYTLKKKLRIERRDTLLT